MLVWSAVLAAALFADTTRVSPDPDVTITVDSSRKTLVLTAGPFDLPNMPPLDEHAPRTIEDEDVGRAVDEAPAAHLGPRGGAHHAVLPVHDHDHLALRAHRASRRPAHTRCVANDSMKRARRSTPSRVMAL